MICSALAAPLERRERVAPAEPRRDAAVAHEPRERDEREPRDEREQHEAAREAARDDCAERQVARRRDQQRREERDAHRVADPRDAAGVAPFAAQHAHRRHARQRRERRQREAEQQHEPGSDADRRRPCRRRRQHDVDQAAERAQQHEMADVAERRARRAAREPEQREFDREQRRQRAAARAEAAHRRAAVEMAAHVALRGHRDRDGREQRGQQRDEREEMARAVERLPHLRLAFLQRFERDAAQLAAVDARMRVAREALDGRIVARDEEPVRDAAAVAREPRRFELVRAQHHARREIDERETAIELAGDRRADRERAAADAQRVADLQMERVEQRRIDPHRARGWNRAGGAAGRVRLGRDLDRAAQRIAGRHRLHGREPHGRRAARAVRRGGRRGRAGLG
ncbi:Uncharacterised protein [Burkholderia pseudomallei]|nr:Uncharacterised protein [Burkholderia pseudomallei]